MKDNFQEVYALKNLQILDFLNEFCFVPFLPLLSAVI